MTEQTHTLSDSPVSGALHKRTLPPRGSALVYGIVLGGTGSLQMTVSGVVWARYYGRRHLGSVSGVAMLVSIVGSALGPLPMGIARDLLGSYRLALTLSAALPLALAVVALWARRPTKRPRPATA